jgi:hypothetical protein
MLRQVWVASRKISQLNYDIMGSIIRACILVRRVMVFSMGVEAIEQSNNFLCKINIWKYIDMFK